MSPSPNFSALLQNISYGSETEELSSFHNPFAIGMLVLFVVIAVLGMSGNAAVLTIFIRTESMRTTANILIANLALADFLTLFFGIPSVALSFIEAHPSGAFGTFLCKFLTVGNMPSVSLTVSILTLTVLAFERYNAIVKPLRQKRRLTKNTVFYIVNCTWLTAVVLILPSFIATEYSSEYLLCYDSWSNTKRQVYHIILLILLFCLPLSVMVYCYWKTIKELYFVSKSEITPGNVTARQNIQDKRQIVKVLLLVSLTFSICFGAFGIARLLDEAGKASHIAYEIALLLLYSNAACDPLVYAFQSSNYKNALKRLLTHKERESIGLECNSYKTRSATTT